MWPTMIRISSREVAQRKPENRARTGLLTKDQPIIIKEPLPQGAEMEDSVMGMPEYFHLPLIPLDLVLFPQMEVGLRVLEEPYKHLIDRCFENEEELGVILFDDEGMREVGCSAKVVDVDLDQESGGEEMDILTVGKQRFRILQIVSDRPYLVGRVEPLEDLNPQSFFKHQTRAWDLYIKFQEILRGEQSMVDEESSFTPEDTSSLSFFLGAQCSFTSTFKQEILEGRSEEGRLDKIIQLLEKAIPQLERIQSARRKILLNGYR